VSIGTELFDWLDTSEQALSLEESRSWLNFNNFVVIIRRGSLIGVLIIGNFSFGC
jgi:hypothetical protein